MEEPSKQESNRLVAYMRLCRIIECKGENEKLCLCAPWLCKKIRKLIKPEKS